MLSCTKHSIKSLYLYNHKKHDYSKITYGNNKYQPHPPTPTAAIHAKGFFPPTGRLDSHISMSAEPIAV